MVKSPASMLDANRPSIAHRDQKGLTSRVLGRRERRRQRALTVPIHIFGRLIALFATKPSRGLAMIDS